MSHRASLLQPSLVRGWITAILCVTISQTIISKVYRDCRMLLHKLFAKLHSINITQSTYWRISISYLCAAELATRSPFSATKLLNCNNHRILFDYFRHTVACSEVIYVRPTVDLHRQTLLLVGSHAAPHRLQQSSFILCTADSFTSFWSQLKTYMFARHL